MILSELNNYFYTNIRIFSKTGEIPSYETVGSSGLDLKCVEAFHLEPGERKLVGTGIHLSMPRGIEGQVRPRSGHAIKKGLSMVNTFGTIDADYRGEIGVILINTNRDTPIDFEAGARIAQLVFVPVIRGMLEPVQSLDDLDATERGSGGFGSTGS